MGEIYCLSADPNSARSQIALSSFIRAMVIKDVLAIVRWVHSNEAEPKMAVCSPVVEGAADFMFMVRVKSLRTNQVLLRCQWLTRLPA